MSDEVSKVLRPHFKDYEIRVVDFAGLSYEELQKYPPDIRFIALFFRCRRTGENLRDFPNITFVHVREILFFPHYVVKDDHLAYEELMQGYGEEPRNMCELINRIIAEGKAEGRAEGILETKKVLAE